MRNRIANWLFFRFWAAPSNSTRELMWQRAWRWWITHIDSSPGGSREV